MHFNHRAVLMGLPILFLISALIGALISYNSVAAWPRFVQILVAVIVFYLFAMFPNSIRFRTQEKLPFVQYVLVILPIIIIVYYLLTNDWASRLGKLPWLDPVLRVLVSINTNLIGVHIDANIFGGVIAALAFLQLGAIVSGSGKIRWKILILIILTAVGLLISESRGAWFALTGVVGIWLLWKACGYATDRWMNNEKHLARLVLFEETLFLVALVGMLVLLTPFGQALVKSRMDRLEVWQNSLALISDYPFTGIGLGGFPLAYSSYVFLLHVNYSAHAHNLYLDLWLDQGALGIGVFGVMVCMAMFPIASSLFLNRQTVPMQRFAFAALCVILVHGIFDDPFNGKAIPFLFVPLSLLARQEYHNAGRLNDKSLFYVLAPLSIAAVTILLFSILSPVGRSKWIANLGALSQTQAELSVYEWPRIPIQDELRRSNIIDLTTAITLYHAALAIDPLNTTANRRLGQIEISLGKYNAARKHLEAAYAASPSNRATRQMLGELYAIDGNKERAIALWKTIDVSKDQLEFRKWWYDHIGKPTQAVSMKSAIDLLTQNTNTTNAH